MLKATDPLVKSSCVTSAACAGVAANQRTTAVQRHSVSRLCLSGFMRPLFPFSSSVAVVVPLSLRGKEPQALLRLGLFQLT